MLFESKAEKPMKNITINIPNQYDDAIIKLVELKLLPSRSEGIRRALGLFLSQESGNVESIESFISDGNPAETSSSGPINKLEFTIN
ncbi:MAG: ribbon-helix-helix domain-containing protein [Promethearchaeota archaeon]